ncbi:MAG TPA: pilus assembly protein [Geobacter sp.]|nr:pilus assembly protein [Geobacter sp.]
MLVPISALIFLTVFCAMLAVVLYLQERQSSPRTELKRRLHRMATHRSSDLPESGTAITRETQWADQVFARLPVTADLATKLDRAGLDTTPTIFVGVAASVALLLTAAVAMRTGILLAAAVAAATVPLVAALLLRFKTEKRNLKFTEQFPDALTMISRSLRAGHSFTTAIQLVGQEIPPPVGPLFKTAYDQQQLGLRMTDALNDLNQRIESLDLRFFTTAISINSDVGGNLSEVLDKLALTIKDRLRIRRQVKVFTAQGRMSGYVLGALPLVALVMFSVVNPEYESALIKEPLGKYILMFAAFMQLAGLMIIRKIIRIRI